MVGLFIVGFGVLFLLRRVLAGYPPVARGFVVLARREVAFLETAAETIFPPSPDLPLSGGEADMPGYADRYLAALPGRQRGLVRALFPLFEHATLVWPARGRGGRRRFSALRPEQRMDALRGWESSRFSLRRMCLTALKAILILGYVGHPETLAALGLARWKIESPRVEADFLYPPIGEGKDRVAPPDPAFAPPAPAPPLVPGLDQETP